MASASKSIRSVVPAQFTPNEIPASFEQAIQTGWKVVGETTTLATATKRNGKVLLGIEGRPEHLAIDYVATPSAFSFATPRIVS